MFAPLKILSAAALAVQVVTSSAFLSHRSPLQPLRTISPHPNTPLPGPTSLQMAVAEAPVQEKVRKSDVDNESADQKEKGWLVRLYNDPMNKREFVARCLMEICGLDDGRAYSVMMHAHQTGLAVVGKYHRELAELYRNLLLEQGLIIDMVPSEDDA